VAYSVQELEWGRKRANTWEGILRVLADRNAATEEPERDCAVCMVGYPVGEMVQMPCKPDEHWICATCMGHGLKVKIADHAVDDPETGTLPHLHLTCAGVCCAPGGECACAIGVDMVKAHVEEAEFAKFLDLRLRHAREQRLLPMLPNESMIHCPNECGFIVIVDREEDKRKVTCTNPACETGDFCGLCWYVVSLKLLH
jgi:hypothetical protein